MPSEAERPRKQDRYVTIKDSGIWFATCVPMLMEQNLVTMNEYAELAQDHAAVVRLEADDAKRAAAPSPASHDEAVQVVTVALVKVLEGTETKLESASRIIIAALAEKGLLR